MSEHLSSSNRRLDEGEIGDDDSKEFDDGYDENLMGDEEDKKKLAQMTEKEREQELFNRSERRETLKIRFEIERKLRTKAKKREQEKKQTKQVRARKRLRASEIYSSDESSEESDEYMPETNNKSSNSSDLNTNTRPGSKMNTRSALNISSSSSASSASSATSSSSSSESEAEHDDLEGDEDSQVVQDDFRMTLAELRTLQLKRDQIEKWVYSPFFKETAIGLFVKISVGNHPQTKSHMYKAAQIIDIVKGISVYALDEFGKSKTDKQSQVRIGRVDRVYKMSFISNRTFDDEDFNKWKELLQSESLDMPSREFYQKKRRDLQKALNYEYKDEDVAYEINERSRFKDNPYNFAMKKTELIGEKADAEAASDFEKAEQIQKIIDDLEEKAKQLEKTRSSSTFSAISFVNERNRIKNIVESERALRESKSVKTEDPFTRRKCTPTIVHNKNNGDVSASKLTDKNGQDSPKDPGSNKSTNSTHGDNPKSMSKPEGVKSVDDLFQAHAGIDIDLDI